MAITVTPNAIRLSTRHCATVILKFQTICSLYSANFLSFTEISTRNVVEHCDDLQYLFTASHIPRITDETSTEGQIVVKYTKLLYSFAKNGLILLLFSLFS